MTFRRQSFWVAFVVLSSLLGLGCGTTSGSATLSSIAITPSPVSINAGATQQLTVTGTFSDLTRAPLTSGVSFSSSAAAVATVSSSGLVTGVSGGTATITASASGVTGTVTVTVAAAAPTLVSIAVTPATVPLTVAGTQQLTVTGTYSDSSTANLTAGSTFVSSATGVATVTSPGGLVTAVAAGTATITATHTASGKTATAAVTVSSATLMSIAVTPATVPLSTGGTQQLTVTGTYSDSTTANLTSSSTFVSSATGVATVSSPGGLVTGVAVGNATITATHTPSGKTATAAVTVSGSSTSSVVFVDNYDSGVNALTGFDGSDTAANPPTRDTTVLNNGHASIKIPVSAGCSSYIGGYIKSAAPRDLSAYNAITFWVKADKAAKINNIGFGNDNTPLGTNAFNVESHGPAGAGYDVTTTFTKYSIPIPNSSALKSNAGLFYFSGGCVGGGATFWINDIQFETVNFTGTFGAFSNASVNLPGTLPVALGTPALIGTISPNTVNYASASVYQVGWAHFAYTPTDPTVATVDSYGQVNGLKAGNTPIVVKFSGATLGTFTANVTVPLAVPGSTDIAPTPTLPPANVISLFSSAYTNVPVNSWSTSWSGCCNDTVDPYLIGSHPVKKYTLRHFVGIQFFPDGTNTNLIDASTMTTFHVDVWTPNPPGRLQIQLVNFPGGTGAAGVPGLYNATGLATGSWVSLDIPLTSFAGLSAKGALGQILFLAQDSTGMNSSAVVYVDNIYLHK